MALPTSDVIDTGLAALVSAIKDERENNANVEHGLFLLGELFNSVIRPIYRANVTFTVTDVAEADLPAIVVVLDAALVAAFKLNNENSRVAEAGDIVKVTGTGDTLDNALQTLKGSAVAADDLFVRTATSYVFAGSGDPVLTV